MGWRAAQGPARAGLLPRAATVAAALSTVLAGCGWLAVAGAPAKRPAAPSVEARAVAADFWRVLHGGRYEAIDAALEAHQRILVEAPGDALTLAHAGWLHAWKLAESAREPRRARIVEHATLARRLFDEAVELDPAEARYRGFAASFAMTEASILQNERALRAAYFRMKDAVAMWPEFNLFTSGYTMSGGAPDTAPFREGLAQQWETLDRCFGERVDRRAPDLRRYLPLETRTGPRRACWNSWIAPHNWEGFFLNFGDMLARSDDLPNARAMYEAARLSQTYAQWPYREVLERRLAHLAELPRRLNTAMPGEAEWAPMVRSAFACTACHEDPTLPAEPPR